MDDDGRRGRARKRSRTVAALLACRSRERIRDGLALPAAGRGRVHGRRRFRRLRRLRRGNRRGLGRSRLIAARTGSRGQVGGGSTRRTSGTRVRRDLETCARRAGRLHARDRIRFRRGSGRRGSGRIVTSALRVVRITVCENACRAGIRPVRAREVDRGIRDCGERRVGTQGRAERLDGTGTLGRRSRTRGREEKDRKNEGRAHRPDCSPARLKGAGARVRQKKAAPRGTAFEFRIGD